ncbi:histone deacetylase complex subunit SAP130-like isoform X2 [Strongylocentrotus purpuratus]|uniref:Histone deacetylase complex subunit SAP130 C-terminal domain-containing protein n=1 Tax=Strongylocentrotus purpuratus TaxID=7668 RepID=A0A7M7NQ66_STRPU|nr:histone deacetylase complex subunit SAP130-like isoform X2 [Strongylocentrotus purpuratus]
MSSHTLPPEGGGGKGPASQTSSSQPPKQQQQQTLTQKLVAEKKPQEKAKVIVQPVHPPLSTTLPLLRQNDSPTPVQQPTPAIIETTVPVIKSSIPNLKQQTVPILSGVASTKPALIPTIPISYTTTTSTAPTTTPITHPHSTSSATPNAPAVVTTQARLAYPPLNVTMTSVVPTRITTTVAAASGATAAAAASAAGGVPVSGVQAQYIPSVQKLPPNSLPAEVPGHTKAGLVPASHLVAGANMLAGQVPYISGSPLGLQLPPGTHPYSTQLPRGPTSTNLSLAATGKSGLTTALLTRAGVPQGAVSTAAFPQQSIYGYSRHHAPGQVHLLTQQRAGSPGVLTAGALPRAASPASTLASSQQHESLRLIPHMIPSSQGLKPDSSTQAKVELKMVIKKDTTKPDSSTKTDAKADTRPSSRTETTDKPGDAKKDGKAEERIQGVKLAVAMASGKGTSASEKDPRDDVARSAAEATKVEMRSSEGRVEMRVDVRPIHRGPEVMGPRWSVPQRWGGLPPSGPTGGLPSHMMTQVVTSVGGMLHPISSVPAGTPNTSSHPMVRAPPPTTSSGTGASQPTATNSGTIPVAKVYPRQQQQQQTQQPPPQVPTSQRFPMLSDQTAGPAYIQMHRSSPGVTASTPASTHPATISTTVPVPHTTPAGATEVKMERPPPHGYALSYYYHPDLGYQHAVAMQQYPGRHGYNPIIRPPVDGQHRLPHHPGSSLNQNSPVAAALAATTHAANMAGAPGRPGQLTMMVGADHRRPIGLQGNTTPGVPSTSVGEGSAEGSVPSFTMAQVPPGALGLTQGQMPPSSAANPGASPRPSILRKRNNDSASSRKPVMASAVMSQPGSPGVKVEITRIPVTSNSPKPSDSLPSSQHSENSNASETSTDTAPLSTGSGPISTGPGPIRIKQETDTNGLDLVPLGGSASTHENSISSLAPSVGSTEEVGPSPRKKPRKQQHIIATEHPMMLDDQSTDDEKETKQKVPFKLHKKEKKEKKNAAKAAAAAAAANAEAEAMKVVQFFKRPCPRLVDNYRQSWKPAHNHFEKYSDVKPKEEKKIGIHEIANQRGILKKTDGWKIHHIAYQFEDLNSMEKDCYDEMKSMKDGLQGMNSNSKLKESETHKLSELVQGSIQRSQYVMEYLEEAKGTILKMLDHKTKVAGIVKKHANKRHVKKKHSP